VDPSTELRTLGLSAGYGTKTVLHAVSLHVPAGQTTVLVGPGGSGKTTLLRALFPDPAMRQGMWLEGQVDRPAACAVLWQSPADDFEIAESFLRRRLGDGFERACTSLWGASLTRTIIEHGHQPFVTLTKDLSQLIRMTPVLTASAPCLILDEPVDGLSDRVRCLIVDQIDQIKGKKTILSVTHHVSTARALADRVALLVEGRIVEQASSPRFFDQPEHPRTNDFLRLGS
jgi:ABC-type branched-subunit amino acid transport system ATPase component